MDAAKTADMLWRIVAIYETPTAEHRAVLTRHK
jgi:hypothetical protein